MTNDVRVSDDGHKYINEVTSPWNSFEVEFLTSLGLLSLIVSS